MHTNTIFDDPTQVNHQQVFRLLVLYRWLSLIPVLFTLNLNGDQNSAPIITLFIAITANIIITAFPKPLNKIVVNKPWVFLADLAVCGIAFYLVDGWTTPYYLYAYSPLLAAAFFFGLSGATRMAAMMSIVYMLIAINFSPSEIKLAELVTRVVGFFLIAGTVGYVSFLLKQLQQTHNTLGEAHRDLKVIHGLTTSLQSAVDTREVQEIVLNAIIDDLRFPKAVIGLVDQDDGVITDWLGKEKAANTFISDTSIYDCQIPLKSNAGHIAESILRGQTYRSVKNITTSNSTLNQALGDKAFHVFPMILREHPIGVLIVDSIGNESSDLLASLESIASQAAVTIGTTMLCIDRARRLAVQEERIRIAREIHDTASQSLFGLNFALNACIKLLPAHPEQVKGELITITELAEKTRKQIRHSIMDIWPTQITAETFAHDLQQYAHDVCFHEDLDLTIRVRGRFQQLETRMKRCLYRVAQEGVNNIVRHSAATEALVCLTVLEEAEVGMIIRDNGRGFDIVEAFKREQSDEHFGLIGIQERIVGLDGTVEVLSQEEVGTAILISLPIA